MVHSFARLLTGPLMLWFVDSCIHWMFSFKLTYLFNGMWATTLIASHHDVAWYRYNPSNPSKDIVIGYLVVRHEHGVSLRPRQRHGCARRQNLLTAAVLVPILVSQNGQMAKLVPSHFGNADIITKGPVSVWGGGIV